MCECVCLVSLVSMSCLCNPLVKVDGQHGGIVLAAHHQWLLQSLDVLLIQVLDPVAVGIFLHLIQSLDYLAIFGKYQLAAV